MQMKPTVRVTETIHGEDAQKGLLEGVKVLHDPVASTLGASGRTVIIEDLNGNPKPTKDGVTVARAIVPFDSVERMGSEIIKQAALNTANEAGDGPQPIDSFVYTPTGKRRMGNLEKGDIICGTGNTYQTVEGVYDKGELEVYEVLLSEGKVVRCSGNHIWAVITNYGSYKTMTTKELLEKGLFEETNGKRKHNFYIPKHSVELYDFPVLLDPYFVGVMIGDGSYTTRDNVELSIGFNKEHILSKIVLPEGIYFTTRRYEDKNYIKVCFYGQDKDGNLLADLLEKTSMLGQGSKDKTIPPAYLYNSIEKREALLKGLLDTDGHINKKGLFEFSTVSEKLFEGFKELVWSLGLSINSRLHTRENDTNSYSNVPIYRVYQLKGYKYGHKIVDIVNTGKRVPMRCIKVSNPDHLYITDGVVPTHNTTTSTVIAKAIIDRGIEQMKEPSINYTDFNRGMQMAVQQITELLDKSSRKVDIDSIESVATISANNDSTLGAIIAEAFQKAGKYGVVLMELSQTNDTYVHVTEGFELDSGYRSDVFVNVKDASRVEFKDALILLSTVKIERLSQIEPQLGYAMQNQLPIVIVAEMDEDLMAMIAYNVVKTKKLQAVVVNPSHFGVRRRDIMGDLAIYTNAHLIDEATGDNFDIILGMDDDDRFGLGQISKVVIDKSKSVFLGNPSEATKSHVESMISQIKNEKNDSERKYLEERIAKLSSSVAVINVGANSQAEQSEIADRVDDAIHATRAALEEGIVAGGGVALYQASKNVNKVLTNGYAQTGFDCVLNACEAPLKMILFNGDIEFDPELFIDPNIGVNVKTGEVRDMFDMGIIDPVKVSKTAIKNAVSAAATLLSTTSVIVNLRKA